MSDQQDANDGLVIVEWVQDADSFGWSIAALLHAAYKPNEPRWGVLDALCGTEVGAHGDDPAERRAATRRLWHLVDWYPSEFSARAAFTELKSRVW